MLQHQPSVAKHLLRRLQTFVSWPGPSSRFKDTSSLTTGLKTSAVVLASSGFQYTGRGDLVTCPICCIEIDGWLRPNSNLSDPRLEHRRRSPLCSLARECSSPVQCSDTSNASPATGISNDGNEDTCTFTPPFGNRGDISANGNVTSACPFKNYMKELLCENQLLIETRTCKVCLDQEAYPVFPAVEYHPLTLRLTLRRKASHIVLQKESQS